jgi:gliding motility-associated-like protein
MVLDSVALIIKVPPIIPPNVFSPNNDGINDTWDIPLLQFFPDCSVEVYNRYGQLVFKSKGYSKNWDGSFNNQTLPIGTYYYIIKSSASANPISGSVLILR